MGGVTVAVVLLALALVPPAHVCVAGAALATPPAADALSARLPAPIGRALAVGSAQPHIVAAQQRVLVQLIARLPWPVRIGGVNVTVESTSVDDAVVVAEAVAGQWWAPHVTTPLRGAVARLRSAAHVRIGREVSALVAAAVHGHMGGGEADAYGLPTHCVPLVWASVASALSRAVTVSELHQCTAPRGDVAYVALGTDGMAHGGDAHSSACLGRLGQLVASAAASAHATDAWPWSVRAFSWCDASGEEGASTGTDTGAGVGPSGGRPGARRSHHRAKVWRALRRQSHGTRRRGQRLQRLWAGGSGSAW